LSISGREGGCASRYAGRGGYGWRMSAGGPDRSPPPAADSVTLARLFPMGPPATVEEIIAGLDLDAPTPGEPAAAVAGLDLDAPAPGEPAATGVPPARADEGAPGRPHVALNMISSVDGRASIDGRSGPLGACADRALFHGLRAVVDAVMVGAGTARVEGYRRLIRDEAVRARRRERGLQEEPLACIVSGRLSLTPERVPLLGEPAARVAILTSSEASLPECPARVEYVRARRDGALDLEAALAELRERFGVRTLLCEGGPHLAAQLCEAGLLDELFLSLAPKLAGGDAPAKGDALATGGDAPAKGDALATGGDAPAGEDVSTGGKPPPRILAGAELKPPLELELAGVLEHEGHLFLRYRVGASSRTGPSSRARAR
jgi:riboflavin biosynthesis pyrimidine reductase